MYCNIQWIFVSKENIIENMKVKLPSNEHHNEQYGSFSELNILSCQSQGN